MHAADYLLARRGRQLNTFDSQSGPVIYWVSRDQRPADNWALLAGLFLAEKIRAPLAVAFCLAPECLGATLRQYDFMLSGLQETAAALEATGIPFFLLRGEPGEGIPLFLTRVQAGALITDFDPLRLKQAWKATVLEQVTSPVWEVDAHNVVPCWLASPKQEYGAYTLRPKLRRWLPDFLEDFPTLPSPAVPWPGALPQVDWAAAQASLRLDAGVPPVTWLTPGPRAARRALDDFLQNRLSGYAIRRNDPSQPGQSDLSPYLHFGQLAPQRVAWEVSRADAPAQDKEALLEELIVRRELADNFCFYNPDYDRVAGFPAWARETLDKHRADYREYLYTLEEFEAARTHDPLWNAAQTEMVRRGKMHGYLRMYWAKKILEWSASVEEALQTAVYLNDRYELDGRDPNGYTGIAWSLGGVHDRPWGERPVFGKIRYMNYAGCRRKFPVDRYIALVGEMRG